MAGKQRAVYFLEAILKYPDGSVEEMDPGFWDALHTHVSGLPTAPRLFTFYNNRYGGSARAEESFAQDYLYLGRRRQRSDFPDYAPDDESEEVALDVPGLLVEPLYVVGVPSTNYAAFMRTSGGPSFEAFERWINHVLPVANTGEVVGLRPYVRRDAIERLRGSDGVAKLNLKFDPDTLRADAADSGTIDGALKTVEDMGGGGVSIEIEVSFGRARPSETGADRYARELERILTNSALTKAQATLLRRLPPKAGSEAPDFAREKVNFLRDQVVHVVRVGDSEADSRTPSIVLSAMNEAIARFRRDLGGNS